MLSVSDFVAITKWWLVVILLGAAATPLAYRLMSRLPDRGYAFSKMLGLLIISYVFWLFGSLGILRNDLGGILAALIVLLLLSSWAVRGRSNEILHWLRENRRYVLLVEALFLFIFVLWSWVRAQNPAITATEKPMELAFLNSAGRSPTMPPLDPWLSGFAISYYYFGYLMTSILSRLAAVPEAIGFNLGVAWLAAGTAVGAFGLVYNMILAEGRRFAGSAITLGLIAALAIPIAGNLQVGLEALHGYDVGSERFWAWLDVREINMAPDPAAPPRYESPGWWWWRSSRVIHEYQLSGRAEEGLEPIAEFPGFSFILGDLHPHVLALPFAFLSLAVALTWWLTGAQPEAGSAVTPEGEGDEDRSGLLRRVARIAAPVGLPLFALTALVLGGLSFLNTWDVLIHLFIVASAFVLGRWRAQGIWNRRLVEQGLLTALLLTAGAIVLYLPFYLGFRSQAGPPFLLPTVVFPTRFVHYAIIFGMSLFAIILFVVTLIAQARRRDWRIALYTALGLLLGLTVLMLFLGWVVASTTQGGNAVTQLANELGIGLPAMPVSGSLLLRIQWGWLLISQLAPVIVASRVTGGGLILLLLVLAGLIVMLWKEHVPIAGAASAGSESEKAIDEALDFERPQTAMAVLPFALLLIMTGVILSLGPEFVYLKDNFGQRLNTIFKFYYQTWVLFGVGALFAIYYLWHFARKIGWVALAGYGLMFAVAMSFPYLAVNSRAAEYGAEPTLDGTAQLARFNPGEYEAIMWLRANAGPSEVVLEAVGGQYSGYGRVSAHSGLPTVLGWPGHEYQWRGDTPEPAEREPAVREIYSDADWARTTELLNRYGIDLIFVGSLEESTYGAGIREKFAERLETAFENGNVAIYRWSPASVN